MTREEAIAELTIHLEHWKRLKEEHIASKDESERTIKAIDMAIEALSADSVSRETYHILVTASNDIM